MSKTAMPTRTQAPTAKTTLPSSWALPTGCLPTDDIWGWTSSRLTAGTTGTQYEDVLGAPSDTTKCYPPGFEPTAYMYGEKCPKGFTSADGRDWGSGTADITCCPTAYDFIGEHDTQFGAIATLPCASYVSGTTTWTVTVTNLNLQVTSTATVTRNSVDQLHAMGIMLVSTSATATATPTSSKPAVSSSGSSGLSSGAIAGIAVGAALLGLLLAGMAWFLFRRAKKSRQQTIDRSGLGGDNESTGHTYSGYYSVNRNEPSPFSYQGQQHLSQQQQQQEGYGGLGYGGDYAAYKGYAQVAQQGPPPGVQVVAPQQPHYTFELEGQGAPTELSTEHTERPLSELPGGTR